MPRSIRRLQNASSASKSTLPREYGVGRAALEPWQRSMNLLMICLLGCHRQARQRGQDQPARDMIERNDIETGGDGVLTHGAEGAPPAAGRALQDDPPVGSRAPARSPQGIVELLFTVDIDDPAEIRRLAIRRSRTGTQAAHAVAAAAQQP